MLSLSYLSEPQNRVFCLLHMSKPVALPPQPQTIPVLSYLALSHHADVAVSDYVAWDPYVTTYPLSPAGR